MTSTGGEPKALISVARWGVFGAIATAAIGGIATIAVALIDARTGGGSSVDTSPDERMRYEVTFSGSTLEGDVMWSDTTPAINGEFKLRRELAQLDCGEVKAVFQAFGPDGRVITGGESSCHNSNAWPKFGPVSLPASSEIAKVSVTIEADGKAVRRAVCPRDGQCYTE